MAFSGIVTLTTDFGLADGYVGQVKGVLLGLRPELRLVDISHAVPPQRVATGGLLLAAAAGAFPPGTVHLLIVDPGVGSARYGLLAQVGQAWLVGPDNGGWSYLARAVAPAGGPVRAWRLDQPRYWRPDVSATFHGRDIFAPVAAHLIGGTPPLALGQPLAEPVWLPPPLQERAAGRVVGRIVHVDHFGNAVSDLAPSDLPAPPAACRVRCGDFTVAGIVRTYAEVAVGAPAALVGSFGTLELARRDGDGAATWGLSLEMPVIVEATARAMA